MHAHRVQILDGADNDHVVSKVTHDLQLILLPAQQRLLNQDLARQRGSQPGVADLFKLLRVVSNATASTAKSEGGPDDDGEVSDLRNRTAEDQPFETRMMHMEICSLH